MARFLGVLQDSVQRRVSRAPPVVSVRKESEVTEVVGTVGDRVSVSSSAGGGGGVLEGRARVAVLFSGGVDSAVLAALVDRYMVC